MTEKQKAFHERNKYRTNIGHCVICKGPTPWNEEKGRYERFCSEECKKKYVEIRNQRMLDKYGTTNLAADIDFQKNKLLANRSIARVYTFKDGSERIVLSKVEYGILEQLELAGFTSDDIDAPAKFVIVYEFEGQKKQHIPDIYVKSLNLIISGKDGMDNPNMHPSFQKDRKKNIAIYKSILDNYNYNYVQIEGEKEVKAMKSTIMTIRKLSGSKSRLIIPPRIDFILYNESLTVPEENTKDRINYVIMQVEESSEFYSNLYVAHDLVDNFYLTYSSEYSNEAMLAVPRSNIINEPNSKFYVLYVSTANIHTYDLLSAPEDTMLLKLFSVLGINYTDELTSLEELVMELKEKFICEPYDSAIKSIEETASNLDIDAIKSEVEYVIEEIDKGIDSKIKEMQSQEGDMK